MRLLEYQAKEVFKEFGIRTPESISSSDIEKGRNDARELGYPFVIKAQVLLEEEGRLAVFRNAVVMMNLR